MQSLLTVLAVQFLAGCATYEPSWDSLDKRPLPEWYDRAKVGIFLHWGVYSVPAQGEWFWKHWKEGYFDKQKFMMDNYRPGFTYQDFAPEFTAKFFRPRDWAELFRKSGAKYVVLTSKHHDGYALWPSAFSYSWNSKDVGPHQDLLGDLTRAVRESGLRMGYYYSLLEWFHPLYMADKTNDFETKLFTQYKAVPELTELVMKYKPDVVWADGEWEANDTYWDSTQFLTWLYNESPVKDEVITNDRWGKDTKCQHGDVYTCRDRYNPGVLQTHKWENAMSLDRRSWGFRANAILSDYLTSEELIEELVLTVSCGGNILINVGPTMDGVIAPIFQERLLDLGDWLSVNGEAIYESSPWIMQNDSLSINTWYTQRNDAVYAIALEWPQDGMHRLANATQLFEIGNSTVVELLGYGYLPWEIIDDRVEIKVPDKAKITTNWAWTFKIYETSE